MSLDGKVFTSAHMTVGRVGENKKKTYARTWDKIWDELDDLYDSIMNCETMEGAFNELVKHSDYYGIGNFIGYEIVCDLRFTPIGEGWTDLLTWANIGPGCKRGLQRLGLPVNLGSLRELYEMAPEHLGSHVIEHHVGWCQFELKQPPFELREIEHSLCEFDKYERTRRGEGTPRERYDGA